MGLGVENESERERGEAGEGKFLQAFPRTNLFTMKELVVEIILGGYKDLLRLVSPPTTKSREP